MSNLEKIKSNAAGIDLGTEKFFVSVDGEQVKSFETYTSSIQLLIAHLKENAIGTVAMEATGVLWIPLYDALEEAGFEVYLVNANHSRNIPAQKSDPADCRWLQRLHSYGLLRASFVPKDDIRRLRTYVRFREDCIELSTSHIMHMQRAFELMNIKLKNVISQLHGSSGIRIVESILSGERDAQVLAGLCHSTILRKKKEEVIKSLEGNYREEYIFLLQQAYNGWRFYQSQIQDSEKQIQKVLEQLTACLPKPKKTKPSPSRHHNPDITNFHQMMVQITDGRDATILPAISDKTVLKLTAELGRDYTKWPTENHFTSWMGLSPRKCESGKMAKKRKRRINTKAGQIFRECALSIANSKHLALKGFYYRIKSRQGAKAAIKATARKLAVLYYRFMTSGLDYVEHGLINYEKQYKEKIVKSLHKKAHDFGLILVPDYQQDAEYVH